jgi:hypothetical protein
MFLHIRPLFVGKLNEFAHSSYTMLRRSATIGTSTKGIISNICGRDQAAQLLDKLRGDTSGALNWYLDMGSMTRCYSESDASVMHVTNVACA